MKTEFDVDVTYKDMFNFLINNQYRSITGVIWLVFSVGVLFIAIYTWGDVNIMNSIMLLLFASLYTIAVPITLYSKAKKQVRNNDSFASTLHYTVDAEGIKVSQGSISDEAKWDEIWKIVKYGRDVVAYIGAGKAFIWPIKDIGDKYNDLVEIASAQVGIKCHIRKSV